MIAPWLQHHLENTGAWNADGISRRAKSRRCPNCTMWVLAGLDAPKCAGAAIVDTRPLNQLGETLALLDGRTTYTLRRIHTRIELDHRNQWAIAAHPAGNGSADVVVEHRCHTPDLPGTATAYSYTAAQETPDEPPY